MVECEQFPMKDTDEVEEAFHKGNIDLFLVAVRIFLMEIDYFHVSLCQQSHDAFREKRLN